MAEISARQDIDLRPWLCRVGYVLSEYPDLKLKQDGILDWAVRKRSTGEVDPKSVDRDWISGRSGCTLHL